MTKAGVDQTVAMKITGHKSTSVYRRYRIVDEKDLRDALAKTQASLRQSTRVVLLSAPLGLSGDTDKIRTKSGAVTSRPL